jgi:hypothetical protein
MRENYFFKNRISPLLAIFLAISNIGINREKKQWIFYTEKKSLFVCFFSQKIMFFDVFMRFFKAINSDN